jgi:hypothetical protein
VFAQSRIEKAVQSVLVEAAQELEYMGLDKELVLVIAQQVTRILDYSHEAAATQHSATQAPPLSGMQDMTPQELDLARVFIQKW